jgi:SET domain-containing protein
MYLSKYRESEGNRLIEGFGRTSETCLSTLLESLRENRGAEPEEDFEKMFETKLKQYLETTPAKEYGQKDLILFAEYISLQKSLWSALHSLLLQLNKFDINQLKESRF